MIDSESFYEFAKIFQNYYGTTKKNVDEIIKKNDILFDIDWQGTKQLSKFNSLKFVKVFLITDNKSELKKRLINRNQNSPKEIERRFHSYEEDIKHWNDYDYIIIKQKFRNMF